MPRPRKEVDEWLAAAQGGSREALGQVLEACRRYLFLVARRELDPGLQVKGSASDLVQDTFLEAQRDFASFQGSSEAELLSWLRRLLLNNLADFTRRFRLTGKRTVEREVSLDAMSAGYYSGSAHLEDTPRPDDLLIAEEQAQLLHLVLDRLPADYRQVITLWYQEEHSFEEIGQLMGRTAGAARMLWWRAIERLKSELEALA